MFTRSQTLLIDVLRHVPVPRFDPLTVRAANFALRTTLASLIALYLALFLQLEEPEWAATTVWIVAQPMRGMALSKSYYRSLGTLTGSVMAITLTALFAQNGALFIVTFAFWIALCTLVSTLLRNFRSYGAVLAGYTCGIIAFAAYGKPDEIFDIAMARVSCIFLGIACEGLVAAVFVQSRPQMALLARLRTICSDAAAFASGAIGENTGGDGKAQRILRDIVALDTAVSYAAAEDRAVRRRAGALRQIIVAVMTSVSAAQALGRHIARSGVPPALQERLRRARELLHRITPENAAAATGETEALHAEMQERDRERITRTGTLDAHTYFVGSRFSDMVGALAAALRRTDDFFAGRPMTGAAELSIHRDYTAAAVNALRAFIAVICAGAFWYVSGWSQGPSFTRIVAIICALFATRDNPVIGTMNFFNGALAAGTVAAFCHLFILPGISGFPLLALMIAPLTITGGILMVRPKTAGIAAAFNIFVISLLGVSNSGRMAFPDFLNSLVPLLGGVGISAVVFKVLFPLNLARRRARIQNAVLRDIGGLAYPGSRMGEARWCSRMADRLSILYAIRPPGNEASLMERAMAALEIGIQTIRLRETVRARTLPAPCQAAAENSLHALTWLPRTGIADTGRASPHRPGRAGGAMRDTAWLCAVLTGNGETIKNFLAGDAGAALAFDARLQLLQAIAAHSEIAEILLTHYLDRQPDTPPGTPYPAGSA